MFTVNSRVLKVIVGAGIAVTMVAGPSAASAESEVSSQVAVTSASCIAQVEAVAARKGIDADAGRALCSGAVTTTETAPQVATPAEVKVYAALQHLTAAETEVLIAAAEGGSVMYRDWTHSYWGGSLLEKHAGRTFWDGSNAWIATYRGLTGANVCHSEGGIAVGWSVSPQECASPGPGSSADAFYRFDASVAFEGSPVTLDIGLHYSTNASGDVSTWQVGG